MSTPPCIQETIKFEKSEEYEVDNEFKLKISCNEELLFIEIEETGKKTIFPKKEYTIFLNLEQLKKIDNYFLQFISLMEIMDSFEELIKMKNLFIIKEEKNIKIRIINPILKKKEIYINIPIIEKDLKIQIDSILSYINSMKTEYDNKINLLECKNKTK